MQRVLRTQKVTNNARSKEMTMGTQHGSVLTALNGSYRQFPAAFQAAPGVVDLTAKTGTVLWSRVRSIAAGSFSCAGSPIAKYMWYSAYGSLVK